MRSATRKVSPVSAISSASGGTPERAKIIRYWLTWCSTAFTRGSAGMPLTTRKIRRPSSFARVRRYSVTSMTSWACASYTVASERKAIKLCTSTQGLCSSLLSCRFSTLAMTPSIRFVSGAWVANAAPAIVATISVKRIAFCISLLLYSREV